MTTLNIWLRAGEKIYLNGAVVRVDRKVRLELLNDATFLLGSHVLQLEEATTPLRRIYFLIQSLLIEPKLVDAMLPVFDQSIQDGSEEVSNPHIRAQLRIVRELVGTGKVFHALKLVRVLLKDEEADGVFRAKQSSDMRKEFA